MKKFCCHITLVFALIVNGTRLFAGELPILPYPQIVQEGKGALSLTSNFRLAFISLEKASSQNLQEHWKKFIDDLPTSSKAEQQVILGLLGKDKRFNALIKNAAPSYLEKIGQEGYVLIVKDKQKMIAANSETGLFYGLQSLKQLIRDKWEKEIVIVDWPSFPHRVIYDDISRGPISTVNYIKQQIERMAEIKINGLSFYIEHVVQPLSHPDFAPDSGKLTIPQIKELSAYAARHHMELMGSFQSFGHFEKILALPQYRSMGETSTLISPLDPKAKSFLENVIGELCEAFGSSYFNVNCDETFDLTKGRSKKYIDSIGAARFYADHLQFLYNILKRHNKKMMMWGDVALEHEEVLDMLPKDVVYLTWEYGDKKSYDQWIRPFRQRGLTYMVCPGILNSYRMFPDMVMAKANIRGFINAAAKQAASGVITTIWDDGGTYLFSGDWYGVYVAADKSWNADTKPEASFDERYEWNAYGTKNGAYVKALNKLMELRALPITYNLNDQVWRQKILPDKGQQMIVNNTSAKTALSVIDESDRLLASANATRNLTDITALQFAIDQYRLVVDTRMQLADVARRYNTVQTTTADRKKTDEVLRQAKEVTSQLTGRHQQLKERFRNAWLKENQHYWLYVILSGYDKRIGDLEELSVNLDRAMAASGDQSNLPLLSEVRLNIKESSDYYFQNWMLGGPFPLSSQDKLPLFLYSENAEYNQPPVPGDFTHYKGKTYRWQKFASQDGGIIDLDETYHAPAGSLVYAYCNITSELPLTVDAFFSSQGGAEIFCNGDKVFGGSDESLDREGEKSMKLSLQTGVNHLLLKLPKKDGRPWSFTYRLDKKFAVTTHKHKYQLNPKNVAYEAD